MDENDIDFAEFEDYKIYRGKNVYVKPPSTFQWAVNAVGVGIGNVATYVGDKYEEYKVNDKIKNGLFTVGNYLYNLSGAIKNQIMYQVTGNKGKEENQVINDENSNGKVSDDNQDKKDDNTKVEENQDNKNENGK